MGCDIHAWIEFRRKPTDEEESPKWMPVQGFGEFSFRDYNMFSSLAQVRGDDEKGMIPRGLPDDVSDTVYWNMLLRVVDDDDPDWEGTIKKSLAESMVKDGRCKPVSSDIFPGDYIEDGDTHSHSWCTAKELASCIRRNYYDRKAKKWYGGLPWKTLLWAMKAVNDTEGLESRLVFWFDS